MKIKNLLGVLIVAMIIPVSISAQVKKKKAQSFTVTNIINAPADKVWQVVGEDYGAIANSHPKIVKSEYISGSLKAGEGSERVCYFNDKETKYLKEKQVSYDPANYTFKNQVFQAGKMPMDPKYTFAVYKVEKINAQKSKLTISMEYRTKPAFMGAFAKGSFKKLIADYAIAVEHHIKTGENVTKENFKKIKKQYKKNKKLARK